MQVRRMSIAARAIILGLVLVPVLGSQLTLAGDPEPAATSIHEPVVQGTPVRPSAFVPGNIHLTFSRIARHLSKPVFITHSGDNNGRLFIVEQTGRIRVLKNGVLQSTPFLDLRSKISTGGSEQGLLGLAFHPDYKTNGKFYVYYTDKSGAVVIAQYLRSSTNASIAGTTGKTVVRITKPYANHNGGMLAFGSDRLLYAGIGDGGSGGDPGNRAQNRNVLLGKILRINIDTKKAYVVPPTNPYVGRTGHDLVWAYGVRNPWRFSFDRLTHDLWIGDVGQERYEEVDRSKAPDAGKGVNYGWRVLEGNKCYNPSTGCNSTGKTKPLATYGHNLGCSVSGGYVYRGTAYPDLAGVYIFGDYCSGRIWGLDAAGPNAQAPVLLNDTPFLISSFGEDQAGNVYVINHGAGEIWRLGDN